jgi:hypothetical protein
MPSLAFALGFSYTSLTYPADPASASIRGASVFGTPTSKWGDRLSDSGWTPSLHNASARVT